MLQDVSSKLLADLQHQLPEAPAAAAPGEVAQPGTAAAMSHQDPEQRHRFLALLSCLVAILHAAVSQPRCVHVVNDTGTLLLTAHANYCEGSSAQGDFGSCSAAATVAALMLGLSCSMVAAAAAACGVSSAIAESSSSNSSPQSAASAAVAASEASSAAFPSASRGVALVLELWQASLQTLQLQQLTVDLAAGVLESLNNTLASVAAAAAAVEDQATAHVQDGTLAMVPQQHVPASESSGGLRKLVSQMSMVFISTLSVR